MNVKTAISLDESLFKKVTGLARELKVSRSRLFAMALEEFLNDRENEALLASIDAAHGEAPSKEEQAYLDRMKKYHRKHLEGEW